MTESRLRMILGWVVYVTGPSVWPYGYGGGFQKLDPAVFSWLHLILLGITNCD